jgi:UDP-N-acetylglucosamine--N-acetylmuramyl-(pentapeptide) pyrophosphoryl-undecaprenol N-acetylglucosamine transferase
MTEQRRINVAVACGGTGGHIFPGLATAQELTRRGHRVTLWLSGRDVESSSVSGWGGLVEHIRAAGFPSGVSIQSAFSAFRLCGAVVSATVRMARRRPDVLLAMGSYASVGPALAARILGVPVVLHEANAIPGRAIALLARFAKAVGITFAEAEKLLRCRRIVCTGLPVRSDFDRGCVSGERLPDLFTVLVMGGSQGAHRLNEVAAEAMRLLAQSGDPVQVIHLSGAADEGWLREGYERAGVPHRVHAFLKEMGMAYHACQLAVCRSGAASCMELALCGVPSLLVPLPSSMRGHQIANARAMERAGGADVILQEDLTAAGLADYIRNVRRSPAALESKRKTLRSVAVPDAAERLADVVVQAAG